MIYFPDMTGSSTSLTSVSQMSPPAYQLKRKRMLFFCPPTITNNNLSLKICCESIVKNRTTLNEVNYTIVIWEFIKANKNITCQAGKLEICYLCRKRKKKMEKKNHIYLQHWTGLDIDALYFWLFFFLKKKKISVTFMDVRIA